MKKPIQIWLEESDMKVVDAAAYKSRVARASWIRSVIIEVAKDQTKGDKL